VFRIATWSPKLSPKRDILLAVNGEEDVTAGRSSGYRSIKRFMAATTSKGFRASLLLLRVCVCLLYSIWRAVDLLVQVELTGEYEHSPIVTADNTLTLLKKETGIG